MRVERGGQADMGDVRTATVAAFRHVFETDEALRGIERRQALKDWVDLLAASHPLDMCVAVTRKALPAKPTFLPATPWTCEQVCAGRDLCVCAC